MDADLEKIVEQWGAQCGLHDFGLVEYGCGCAPGDYRPVVLELVRQLQERRDECQRLSQLLLVERYGPDAELHDQGVPIMEDLYRPLSWAEMGRAYDAIEATEPDCCDDHDDLCLEAGACCPWCSGSDDDEIEVSA